jgi:hypothetical protein
MEMDPAKLTILVGELCRALDFLGCAGNVCAYSLGSSEVTVKLEPICWLCGCAEVAKTSTGDHFEV